MQLQESQSMYLYRYDSLVRNYFRFNWRLCIWETEREKGRNTREISTVKRPWGPCIHTYICLFFTTNEFSLLNGPPLASYCLDGQKWHLLCQISADCKYTNNAEPPSVDCRDASRDDWIRLSMYYRLISE